MPEMIFIFLLALILFGPKKLPEIGREIGKFLAEFKRASNDFKSQIQSEMEKAGVDTSTLTQSGGQQSKNFAQTLLPPQVSSTIKEIDEAQERLRRAARMAFEAQSFTLHPPETPVVAQASEPLTEPPTAAETQAASAAATSPAEAPAGESTPPAGAPESSASAAVPVAGNSAGQSS